MKTIHIAFVLLALVFANLNTARAADPLLSWNDGKAKQSIVDFVAKVTKEGSPDFIPPAERIATFDNDGTLWAEQPLYFQFLFALDRVKVMVPEHPEWKEKEPFASLLKGDMKGALAGGEKALLEIVTGINLDPPAIFASDTPAILVILAGKPRFEKVEGTGLMFAANTNWDLFLENASGKYYLLNGESWLTTDDLLKGKWSTAAALPADLSKLPDNDNWKDVKQNIPGKAPKTATTVIVTTEPAELIVTEGKPQFEPIPGTKLMMVANTDADLFFNMTQQQYYFLAAGRWFRAKELAGPWSAATADLPKDFANIPEDSEAADVLPSVPGTVQAQEAVLEATTPRKATVNRNDVSVTVNYQGAPVFQPIQTTTIQYAINTPNQVFLTDNKYYCCFEGVWFESTKATGPWVVCIKVAPVIYTVPPTHPAYNVTYVYVYSSTPTTVVVGSTAGYSGQYVANGIVLFGAGMIAGAIIANNNDYYWRYHYSSCYFSYGCGAHYSHYHGGFYTGGYKRYGPYGGAGAWSGYNPSTGVISRGAYRYGPAGSASVRTAYNPWTGNSAARVTASTPYGSWGRSAVTNGEDWARGGYKSNARGTVAGVQTSEGAGAVAAKGRYGNGGVVAKDKDGDVYVGKNGNAYKRDDSGNWSQRENGQWKQPEGKPQSPRTQSAASSANTARTSNNATYQDLDRQAESRDRASTSSQKASQRSSQPAARPTRSSGGTRGKSGR